MPEPATMMAIASALFGANKKSAAAQQAQSQGQSQGLSQAIEGIGGSGQVQQTHPLQILWQQMQQDTVNPSGG